MMRIFNKIIELFSKKKKNEDLKTFLMHHHMVRTTGRKKRW